GARERSGGQAPKKVRAGERPTLLDLTLSVIATAGDRELDCDRSGRRSSLEELDRLVRCPDTVVADVPQEGGIVQEPVDALGIARLQPPRLKRSVSLRRAGDMLSVGRVALASSWRVSSRRCASSSRPGRLRTWACF